MGPPQNKKSSATPGPGTYNDGLEVSKERNKSNN